MTTNDELIERCARAADERFRAQPGYWDDTEARREFWRNVASAVLAEAASETEPRPPVPERDGEATISNTLCGTCGHWHASNGRPLYGWRSNYGKDRYHELPAGHMPPEYTIDAATGWDPVYGSARLCQPAPAPSGPRVAPEPREEAARLRATLERVVTAYFDEDDSTDAAIKARDDELDAAIAAARALLAGRPEQEADRG